MGIINDSITGPNFDEEYLTGERHLQFLRTDVIPIFVNMTGGWHLHIQFS